VAEEQRELTMTPGTPAAPARTVALPPCPWPPERPDWWIGHVLAVVDGLTRTRLTHAAKAIATRLGDPAEAAIALYERSNAVLSAGLGSADVSTLKADLALLGVQARAYDTEALLPCPPPRGVDEVRWDAGSLRLRTPLGVHAVPWRELVLGLLAIVRTPGSDDDVPVLDLFTAQWERFRFSGPLTPPARGARDDGLPSLPRLAAAVLDKTPALPRNDALTALSIHQVPRGPVFDAAVDHEAWSTLWLAHARQPRR